MIKNAGKQFEISQIFAWSIQASTALKYLHIEKKIAHRDIKPGYICTILIFCTWETKSEDSFLNNMVKMSEILYFTHIGLKPSTCFFCIPGKKIGFILLDNINVYKIYRNIFLTENDQIKLGDLGCSRTIDSSNTELTMGVGTLPYMSPEVKNGNYNFNSDIW